MNQNERILRQLKIAPLTPLDALRYVGSMRLSARIWDLRRAGHHIDSVLTTLRNGKRVSKYILRKP